MASRLIRYGLLLMCLSGVWHLAMAGKVYCKAWLANQLIEHAWQKTLKGKSKVRPWPWADTWPVAELSVPRLHLRQIILSGDSGRVLAFGPGMNESSAIPGKSGLSIISGHRDTSFSFLNDIRIGDQIVVTNAQGKRPYRIEDLAIVDQRYTRINMPADRLFESSSNIDDPTAQLIFVTCYPFDGLTSGGHLRFLAIAKSQNNAS